MYRINFASGVRKTQQSCVATIGNFDGVHLGHQELLQQLSDWAKSSNSWRMLLTFDLLPHEYFADQALAVRTPRIELLRDKIAHLRETGLVDEVVILHFSQSLARVSPREFIQHYLLNILQVTSMVVGHDFRFGFRARGGIKDLQALGIATQEFAEICDCDARISSSLIRELASAQQLEAIRNYLGRAIYFSSRIVRGNQLARKWGMPTINLNLYKIKPMLWGIYTSYVYIEGQRYFAVTNIGKNPTVSAGLVYKIESHLLNVDLDLYGKIATVEILHYLRPELKFNDVNALFKQMQLDLSAAYSYFKLTFSKE
jgi:riboflavin kinase/FMN adenylyltransferase